MIGLKNDYPHNNAKEYEYAVYFDNLYVQKHPYCALKIANKWHDRKESKTAFEFDSIVISTNYTANEASAIADKYFEYNNHVVAFDFDTLAVEKDFSLSTVIADKWYNRSIKQNAIYFDNLYVNNEIGIANFTINKWHQADTESLILELSKIYSKIEFDIVDSFIRKYYGLELGNNLASRFAATYLKKKFDLSWEPSNFWLEDDSDILSKYILIYSQLRIDLEYETISYVKSLIRSIWHDDQYYPYPYLKEKVESIRNDYGSEFQKQKLYDELYHKVMTNMKTLIVQKWYGEENSQQPSKAYLHSSSDLVGDFLSALREMGYYNLASRITTYLEEIQEHMAFAVLQNWHHGTPKEEIISLIEENYLVFPTFLEGMIAYSKPGSIEVYKPISEKESTRIPKPFSSNDPDTKYIYAQMTEPILSFIVNKHKVSDADFLDALRMQLHYIHSESIINIIEPISDKWYARGRHDVSLDFHITFLNNFPDQSKKINATWQERNQPRILEEIDKIAIIEDLLKTPTSRKIAKVLLMLDPDSPIKQNFSESIFNANLSPLEHAILLNDLESVTRLTSTFNFGFWGKCTPEKEIALLLASTLKQKEIYNYLCEVWGAPQDLSLNIPKTLLSWFCLLNPEGLHQIFFDD